MPTDAEHDDPRPIDPTTAPDDEPSAPHADPNYDEPGDNPLAAEDDDD
jgi:hypothetical protein